MAENNGEKKQEFFSVFDIHCVNIMSELLRQEASTETIDEVIDQLRFLKLEHYSLTEKNRILEKQINIDQKTGLLKYNDHYLETIVKVASRALDGKDDKKFQISYIRLDIDDFSSFNNKYGHDIGDKVLNLVAKSIKNVSRPTDYCIRFGGEEFDIMLPATNREGSQVYLKKLFKSIREIKVPFEKEILGVTVSAGASIFSIELKDLCKNLGNLLITQYKNLQREADNALYEAKLLGKDQFAYYEEEKKNKYIDIRKQYINK